MNQTQAGPPVAPVLGRERAVHTQEGRDAGVLCYHGAISAQGEPRGGTGSQDTDTDQISWCIILPLMGAEPLPLGQTWCLALGPPWEADSSSVGSPCP